MRIWAVAIALSGSNALLDAYDYGARNIFLCVAHVVFGIGFIAMGIGIWVLMNRDKKEKA